MRQNEAARDTRQHELQKVVCSFESPERVAVWSPINDGVMGGLSHSTAQWTDQGSLCFSGVVSFENGGGFASVRSDAVAFDLSGYDGITMRVRGDGRRYAFNLRTEFHISGGSYRCHFETKPQTWIEHYFPFATFEPTSFGRTLHTAPPLDTARIRSFGLLISNRQDGPFSLEVAWIRAVVVR